MSGMDETRKAVSLCSGIYLGVSVHMSMVPLMVPLFPQSIRDNVEDHLASTHPLSVEFRRAPCPGSSPRYSPALWHSLVLSSVSKIGQGQLLWAPLISEYFMTHEGQGLQPDMGSHLDLESRRLELIGRQ